MLRALNVFQTNLDQGLFLFDTLQNFEMKLTCQKLIPNDSITEVFSSEDFQWLKHLTQDDCQRILQKLKNSSELAEEKLLRYFEEEGKYKAHNFLKQLRNFNPVHALKFSQKPFLGGIPGFSEVPVSEFVLYRRKCEDFQSQNVYQMAFVFQL